MAVWPIGLRNSQKTFNKTFKVTPLTIYAIHCRNRPLFKEKKISTHVVVSAEQIDVLLANGVVEVLEVLCRRKPAGLSHLRVRGQAVVPSPVYYRGYAVTVEV